MYYVYNFTKTLGNVFWLLLEVNTTMSDFAGTISNMTSEVLNTVNAVSILTFINLSFA